jgi:hypothetical protein
MSTVPPSNHTPMGDKLEQMTRQLIENKKLSALSSKETRILHSALKTLRDDPKTLSEDRINELVERIKPILESDKPKKTKILKIWHAVLKFFNIRISKRKLLALLREQQMTVQKKNRVAQEDLAGTSTNKMKTYEEKENYVLFYLKDYGPPFDLFIFESPLFMNRTPDEKRRILNCRIQYLEGVDKSIPANRKDLKQAYHDYVDALKAPEEKISVDDRKKAEQKFFDLFEDFERLPSSRMENKEEAPPLKKIKSAEEKSGSPLPNMSAELVLLDLLIPDPDELPPSREELEEIMNFVNNLPDLPSPPDEPPLTPKEQDDLNKFIQELINE